MSPVPREYQFEAAVETDWRNTWLKITSRKQRQSTLWFTLGFIIFLIWIIHLKGQCKLLTVFKLSGSGRHGYQGWMPQNFLEFWLWEAAHWIIIFFQTTFKTADSAFESSSVCAVSDTSMTLIDFFRIGPFWRWHIAEMVDSNEMPRAKSEVSRLLAFRRDDAEWTWAMGLKHHDTLRRASVSMSHTSRTVAFRRR